MNVKLVVEKWILVGRESQKKVVRIAKQEKKDKNRQRGRRMRNVQERKRKNVQEVVKRIRGEKKRVYKWKEGVKSIVQGQGKGGNIADNGDCNFWLDQGERNQSANKLWGSTTCLVHHAIVCVTIFQKISSVTLFSYPNL